MQLDYDWSGANMTDQQEATAPHSPTPWRIPDPDDGYDIEDAEGRVVCAMYGTHAHDPLVNRQFVIDAVNCHERLARQCDALLEACKSARASLASHAVGAANEPFPQDAELERLCMEQIHAELDAAIALCDTPPAPTEMP